MNGAIEMLKVLYYVVVWCIHLYIVVSFVKTYIAIMSSHDEDKDYMMVWLADNKFKIIIAALSDILIFSGVIHSL